MLTELGVVVHWTHTCSSQLFNENHMLKVLCEKDMKLIPV